MRIALIAAALGIVACGGGGGGSGGPTEADINITATGFASPTGASAITIPSGGRIHFFNKDTVSHQVTSNCTELDTNVIAPGGDSLQPTMTGPLNCSYNDVNKTSLTGSVVVNAPSSGGGGGGGSGY
jgi:hypothetical protein